MMERSRQDILNKKETGKMCLSDGNELGEMCSVEDDDTCSDGVVREKRYVEIFEFTHAINVFSFDKIGKKRKEKSFVKEVTVVIALDFVTRSKKVVETDNSKTSC